MVVKTKSLGTRSTTYLSFLSRGIGLGHIFNRIACIVAQRPTLPHHEAKAGPHRVSRKGWYVQREVVPPG